MANKLVQVGGIILKSLFKRASVPILGNFTAGDICVNTAASFPVGWKCLESGTPGTWAAFGAYMLAGSASFDPPALAAGATTSTTVDVAGAELGDFAIASFSVSLVNIMHSAFVSSAGVVTIILTNPTGTSVNIPSSLLRVLVMKK